MATRIIIFCVLLLFLGLIPLVIAQQSSQQYFLPDKVSFVGEKSFLTIFNREVVLQRTFNIVPVNNTEPLNVTFISSRLYSVDSSDYMPAENIHFSKNNTIIESAQEIIIQLDVDNQKSGTYNGEFIALVNSAPRYKCQLN